MFFLYVCEIIWYSYLVDSYFEIAFFIILFQNSWFNVVSFRCFQRNKKLRCFFIYFIFKNKLESAIIFFFFFDFLLWTRYPILSMLVQDYKLYQTGIQKISFTKASFTEILRPKIHTTLWNLSLYLMLFDVWNRHSIT